MTGVDTNILVYARRAESPWNAEANAAIGQLVEGRKPWAIPWPCLHEFVGTVTRHRYFNPPTPLDHALQSVAAWLASPYG